MPSRQSYASFLPLLVTLTLGLVLALVWAPPAAAAPPPGGPPPRPDWELSLDAGYAAPAEVHGSGAEASATDLKLSAGWKGFSLTYERVDYSWDDPGRLPFNASSGDPWDSLHVVGVGYRHRGFLSPKWMYFAGGAARSAFEEEMDDSWSLRAFGGVGYRFSDKLTLSFGALVSYHKVDTLAIPIMGLTYNRGATQGVSGAVGYPITYLAYHFNPAWAVVLRVVEFDRDYFRLADDSPVERRGYLERQDLSAAAGVKFTPTRLVSLYVGARYYFNREFTIHDEDADRSSTYDLDNAWGGVARVEIAF
jgi:hypothetical protein